MSKSMDLQKKLKLFRVDSIHKWEEKLKQVSPTGREETVSEINREPVPEDKIRETHAHRGTSIVERGSGNARHKGEGRAWTFYRRNVPARPPTIDEQREERKKKGSAEGLKESSHVSASRRWNGNKCSSR